MNRIEDFVSREAYTKIVEFEKLLVKWNKVINLISPKTVQDIANRHILDSLQLLSYMGKDSKIIDLGSGAGFPAIILSIAGVTDVTLIESDSRKSAFLLQAAKLSNGKVRIINDRIENIDNLTCDILTSRAFSELNSIFEYSSEIEVKDKYLLHKGAGYKNEISKAKNHWLFNETVHDSITSETGKILEITNLVRI
jgi:16S rRNA (guanine527-N7)-methyltransferase